MVTWVRAEGASWLRAADCAAYAHGQIVAGRGKGGLASVMPLPAWGDA